LLLPMKIIVGIPGCWSTREAIAEAVNARAAFKLDGDKLRESKSGKALEVDIYEHDPRLKQAFVGASFSHPLAPDELEAIGKHTFTVYLLGTPGLANARRMLRAAAALLDAGGLAVKVETSGVAHSAERWRELDQASADPTALYRAFVALVGGPDDVYSCGMHNLEEADAIVVDSVEKPAELVHHFVLYRLLERTKMKEGEAFAISEGAPRYKLRFTACRTYPEGDLFFNPYGMWRLSPMDATPVRRRLDS